MRRDGMHDRSLTFDKSDDHLADPNGLKASIATAETEQTYTEEELDGTNVCGAGYDNLASWPSVTTGAHVGAHVIGSSIFFTGTYDGATVVREALLTDADGGETVLADGPLDIGSVTEIRVEAQADDDGTFEFGWSGVAPQKGRGPWRVVARAAGAVHVANESGQEDAELTLPAHGAHEAWVSRIFEGTAVDVTAYE